MMDRTVRLAADHGVAVGAHPGFPDRLGFGRRNMDCSPDEIRDDVRYQVGALRAFCDVHGVRLQHVKPHGSLYTRAAGDERILRAVAHAVAGLDPTLLLVMLAGADNERMRRIGREEGVQIIFEAFPDRAYRADGALVSRRHPGAVVADPEAAAERALWMAREGRVRTVEGSWVPLDAETLCIHGDSPCALELARTIRGALEQEGIRVVPMAEAVVCS